MKKSCRPVSREQRIFNHVFPFSGDLARQHSSDMRAISICERLIALTGSALQAIAKSSNGMLSG